MRFQPLQRLKIRWNNGFRSLKWYFSLTEPNGKTKLHRHVMVRLNWVPMDSKLKEKNNPEFIVMAVVAFVFLLTMFFAGAAHGQAAPELVIRDITVIGNSTIEVDTILYALKSRIGQPAEANQIRRDIKALYRSGFFDEVNVEYEAVEDGIKLIYIVKERPIITDIVYSGVESIAMTTVKEVVTVEQGKRYNPILVEETVNLIEEKYREKGYQYVLVSPRLTSSQEGVASLIFAVDEGLKVRVKEIKFIGNHSLTDGTRLWGLRQRMKKNRTYQFFSWVTNGGYLKQDFMEEDIAALEEYYKNKGFLQVSISKPEIIKEEPLTSFFSSKMKQYVTIVIRIDEGAVYHLGKIDVRVDDETVFPAETIKQVLNGVRIENYRKYLSGSIFSKVGPRFAEGERYSYKLEQESLEQLSDLYGLKGYIYAYIDPAKTINDETHEVDIVFTISEGPQAFLHSLEFIGNYRTRDRVLRRNFMLAEGDVFNSALIKQSIARIHYLSYIDEVLPDIQPAFDQSQVDVKINLMDNKQTELQLAGGYSESDGFYGHIGVSEHNLFGRGQEFSLSATAGDEYQTFSLSFMDDWIFDRPISTALAVWNAYSNRDYEYSKRKTIGGSISGGRGFRYYVRTRVTYKLTTTNVYDIEEDADETIFEAEGTSLTSSLIATTSRDTTDNNLDPTRGTRTNFSVEYAGGVLGGDNDFYKTMFSWAYYYKLPQEMVFAFRSEFDYGDGLEGQELPFYERFRLGGSRSIRGYPDRSIGPWDEDGRNEGGNKAVQLTAEIQIPIAGPLKTVLFADAGDTYAKEDSVDLRTLRPSVGVEIRFLLPHFYIPLRFIWGYNLDPLDDESRNDFEFTMGTMF